jgi:hypothetical protein
MTPLVWMLLGATALCGLYGLHRCALWMEGRGWIYYLKASDRRGGPGTAFLETQAIPEPTKRHRAESKRSEVAADDDSGDARSQDASQQER